LSNPGRGQGLTLHHVYSVPPERLPALNPVTITAINGGWQLDVGDLVYAEFNRDGSLLIGGLGTLGLVRAGRAQMREVPCIARGAVHIGGATFVACDHQPGLIRVDESGPTEFGRADVVFQKEADVKQSRLLWAGDAAGGAQALFASGSGKTVTITLDADRWSTAEPWRGRGCDTVVHGMEIGRARNQWVGASIGRASIPRTAVFDAAFTHATSFSVIPNEAVACGIGADGPVCLLGDGRLVNPTRRPVSELGRLGVKRDELAAMNNRRICQAGLGLYVLTSSTSAGVAVYRLRDGRVAKLFDDGEPGLTASLTCANGRAVAVVSNGITSRVLLLDETPLNR